MNRSICVCLPGDQRSIAWVFGWSELLIHLMSNGWNVRYTASMGNNIYQVREGCIDFAFHADPNGAADYILWIDADNPPSAVNFDLLIGAMDASPEVSIVGGWYRFSNPVNKEVYVAAGWQDHNIHENVLIEADRLIEVEFVGFGMCLMRRQVIDDIGLKKCFEPYQLPEPLQPSGRTWLTDDIGFCRRAREKGHRVFVHPAVFLHHEKVLNVPSNFEAETPILKEL